MATGLDARGRGSGALTLLIAAAVLLTAVAGEAHATEDDDYGAAVASALSEYQRGNWAEARALFLRAHALQPSARTLRTLGMVAFEMREYVTAHDELSAALRDPRRPLDEALRAEVSALLRRAEAFLGRYRVTLQPAEATLLVDGAPARIGDDGTLRLSVGVHTLSARAPGHVPVERRLRVEGAAERRSLTFVLDQARSPRAPALTAPPASPGADGPDARAVSRPWMWASAAAAVAFGAAAVGLHLSAKAERDALARECDRRNAMQWGSCTRQTPVDESTLDLLDALTVTSAVLGGVCAGTAIALRFVEGDDGAASAGARLRIGPTRIRLEGWF